MTHPNHRTPVSLGIASLLLPLSMTGQAQDKPKGATPPAPKSPWTYSVSAAVREAWDDNVYLQDEGALADRDSFVTSIIPSATVSYKPSAAFNGTFSYTPEASFYHSEDEEDNIQHKMALNLGGKSGAISWDQANSITDINGSATGVIFAAPGAIPSAGGIPIRDRRDATIYKHGFKLTYTSGSWFFRPNATFYLHDFQTRHSAAAGYGNYVDRWDANGGIDVGFRALKEAAVTLGYRFGHQDQSILLGNPIEYSNDYQRFLLGLEGKLFPWMKVAASAGPDLRDFTGTPAAGFDGDGAQIFADCVITLTPTKEDTIALTFRDYMQPGFGGRSVYADSTYEATWKHKFTDKLTAGIGAKAYNTDFQPPVTRNDWIYTGSAVVAYAFSKQLAGELSYSHDWSESAVPFNTSGREFTRNLVALGIKYNFL